MNYKKLSQLLDCLIRSQCLRSGPETCEFELQFVDACKLIYDTFDENKFYAVRNGDDNPEDDHEDQPLFPEKESLWPHSIKDERSLNETGRRRNI